MARIRSIKPEFYRHEELQDLEAANPGAYVMLVFSGLWGHCDKEGRFLWKPRTLKLDILPFLDYDLSASLVLLWEAGLVRQYEIDGILYGEVPTFKEHQRVSGKEAQEPAKHPDPKGNFTSVSRGSNGEAPETAGREGKGKEEEGKKEPSSLRSEGRAKAAPVLIHDSEATDPKKALYDLGKQILPGKSGGRITQILNHYDGDVAAALRALRLAAEKSDPSEYVGAILRGETRSDDVLAETDALYKKWGVS